ncbi:MAG: phosphate signaling complex protein PhoU [Bacillota bacterium]|jgi:phosphate transport system protein|nr:phosphate signaling complex protein PhoU [Candidatus Fermentithermobacillaceae bacterium]
MPNPRRTFDRQLAKLDEDLLAMGREAEAMLGDALKALKERDAALADATIARDDVVDRYRYDIERRAMEIIATQQPAARDLRRVFAAIAIAADVERVGDYSVDICKTAKRLADKPLFKPLVDIPRMAGLVVQMLRDSLEGFVSRDLALIEKMIGDDDEVDHLYRYLHDELCDFMMKDPELVDQAVQLVLISRHLERIADHITNIGERVFYVETGELKELHQ